MLHSQNILRRLAHGIVNSEGDALVVHIVMREASYSMSSAARTFSHSLLVCLREEFCIATPALFTSTSIGPSVSSTWSAFV